ncbi:hypothetical protein [Actinomadura formosensis]|uniref:hypothetical protein n=1 Tax=Actinomadura formosensis TaxID=60706 RepID=UPI003D8E6526
MTPADDVIARAARAIAPHFREHGLRWPAFDGKAGTVFVPGEAEIALRLKDMVARVEPGGRFDCGHLIVEWPLEDVEDDGEEDVLAVPGAIRILFHLADIEPEEPKE